MNPQVWIGFTIVWALTAGALCMCVALLFTLSFVIGF